MSQGLILVIEKDTFTGATYLPDGPQMNVSISTLTSGGWTQCHTELYSNVLDDAQIDVIQGKCNNTKTFMACKKVDSDHLTLAAWANTTTVYAVTDTDSQCQDSCTSQVEAGSRWYRTPKAWGFAAANNSLFLNSVDRADIRTSGQEGTGGTRLNYYTNSVTGNNVQNINFKSKWSNFIVIANFVRTFWWISLWRS